MRGAEFLPGGVFPGQRVALKCRQGNQRGCNSKQDVAPGFNFPARFKPKVFDSAPPTFKSQAAAIAQQTKLAQFVIADGKLQPIAKTSAKLMEALTGAFQGCGIGEPERCAVAGEVTI